MDRPKWTTLNGEEKRRNRGRCADSAGADASSLALEPLEVSSFAPPFPFSRSQVGGSLPFPLQGIISLRFISLSLSLQHTQTLNRWSHWSPGGGGGGCTTRTAKGQKSCAAFQSCGFSLQGYLAHKKTPSCQENHTTLSGRRPRGARFLLERGIPVRRYLAHKKRTPNTGSGVGGYNEDGEEPEELGGLPELRVRLDPPLHLRPAERELISTT